MKGFDIMSVLQAKNNYLGLGGSRMNCAQSVASAFKEKFKLTDEFVNSFMAYGGGRAPEGVCGAYYAAMSILNKVDKEKANELKDYFREHAGAFECSNIKSIRRLSCVGCVEKCSGFLEKIG